MEDDVLEWRVIVAGAGAQQDEWRDSGAGQAGGCQRAIGGAVEGGGANKFSSFGEEHHTEGDEQTDSDGRNATASSDVERGRRRQS